MFNDLGKNKHSKKIRSLKIHKDGYFKGHRPKALLGELIGGSEKVRVGMTYYYKFYMGDFWIDSSSSIHRYMINWMSEWGTVVDVSRNLFSKYLTIQFVPKTTTNVPTVEDTVATFMNGFIKLGEQATFISADTTATPDTIQTITGGVGSAVGNTAGGLITETLKPLIPLIAIGFAGFLALEFVKAKGRR